MTSVDLVEDYLSNHKLIGVCRHLVLYAILGSPACALNQLI